MIGIPLHFVNYFNYFLVTLSLPYDILGTVGLFPERKRGLKMKRLQVLLLVALSSTLLLFGCGKKEEETVVEPVVEQVIEDEPEVVEEEEVTQEEIGEDVPPEEGMVRSRITNEWVTEEVNNTRPITVMHYSRTGVILTD